jgi:hypothetical protein
LNATRNDKENAMPGNMQKAAKGICALLTIAAGLGAAHGETDDRARVIAGALLAAPQSIRDGATVVLDAPHAPRVVLRQGSNGFICSANVAKTGFLSYCYPKALDPFWIRNEALAADGKSGAEISDALAADARSGKLNPPVGATTYEMGGASQDSALPHMIVFLPNATESSTGLSARLDYVHPWLMWAGTPVAHVMIPGK